MARWLGIAGACGALVACGASSAAPRAGNPQAAAAKCGAPGSRTLAHDKTARVYQAGGQVYGCVGARGRSFRLGSSGRRAGQPTVGVVKVAGEVAAYSLNGFGVDTSPASVVVRRLSDGRVLHRNAATSGTPGPEFFESVLSLVVKPSGGVAWIGSVHSIGRPGQHPQVVRHDRRGLKVLDTSPSIALRSLRLHGSTLHWKDAGARRVSTLR